MPTISGVVSKNIVATGVLLDDTYTLAPYDSNGVGYDFLELIVNTTLGPVTLNLPEISDFSGAPSTEIRVVATTGAADTVTISCSGTDKIGSATTDTLTTNGGNAVLTVASSSSWSIVKSA